MPSTITSPTAMMIAPKLLASALIRSARARNFAGEGGLVVFLPLVLASISIFWSAANISGVAAVVSDERFICPSRHNLEGNDIQRVKVITGDEKSKLRLRTGSYRESARPQRRFQSVSQRI